MHGIIAPQKVCPPSIQCPSILAFCSNTQQEKKCPNVVLNSIDVPVSKNKLLKKKANIMAKPL